MTRAQRIERIMVALLKPAEGYGIPFRFQDHELDNAFNCATQLVDYVDQKTAPLAGTGEVKP
jgi:hypothetical protein